jgi:peroxiredoxin Q/BCP
MSTIQPNSKAPTFKGKDQNGNTISLADFKGKNIVLYFYPQDDTPTCTTQACNFRDNFDTLTEEGFVVIGVSPDQVVKHKKFETKHQLPFVLIADPELNIIEKYGVWGEKSMYGKKYMGLLRTTFLIDTKGIIKHIITKPKAKIHTEEILSLWNS